MMGLRRASLSSKVRHTNEKEKRHHHDPSHSSSKTKRNRQTQTQETQQIENETNAYKAAEMASNSAKYQPETCPPPDWELLLDAVTRFRSSAQGKAAVDVMGVEALSTRWAELGDDENTRRFRTLVALMLSSQTKDEVTSATVMRLVQANGCSPTSLAQLSVSQLNELISRVGFHNRKAMYIHAAACRIQSEFSGRVPGDLRTLLSFAGVGPKMALLFLQSCDALVQGISVDVHMHRIFKRWGWTSPTCSTPEHTRQGLEAWLPQQYWAVINPLVVGFGQRICQAQRPLCSACPIHAYCPSYSTFQTVSDPHKKEKTSTLDIEEIGTHPIRAPKRRRSKNMNN